MQTLNNQLRISENLKLFSNFINKKGPKPTFLDAFQIETQFKDGIFGNEYVVILKSDKKFFKIVAFYSSYYGIVFDESSKFIEVTPKLVTVTRFENIQHRIDKNNVTTESA